MKKLLVLAGLFVIGISASAQRFPSTDSLRRYINFNIRNSAVQSFTNLRLNTALLGLLDWTDSARAGEGGAVGVDTIYATNDSTIRYRKNGTFYSFVLKGVYDGRRKVDSLYMINDTIMRVVINGQIRTLLIRGIAPTASGGGPVTAHRGLTAFGTRDVVWGGSLDSIVDIDQAGFQIAFRDGPFQASSGDYLTKSSDYSQLYADSIGMQQEAMIDDQVVNLWSLVDAAGVNTQIRAYATNAINTSSIIVKPSRIDVSPDLGELYIHSLIDSAQTYGIFYDPGSGKFTYGLAASGGGGDDKFGADDIVAIADRDFNQDGFTLTIHGGDLKHGTGDFVVQATDFTLLESTSSLFRSIISDGTDTSTISNALGAVTLNNTQGNLFFNNIIDSAQGYQVYINPTNWKVTYGIATNKRFGFSGEDDAAAEDRDFDQNHNGFTFHDGVFKHGTENYLTETGEYSLLRSDSVNFNATMNDGAGTSASVGSNITSGGNAFITAIGPGGGAGVSVSVSTGINISDDFGRLFIRSLIDSAQAYQLFWNPSTEKVTYALSTAGGTGAGDGIGAVYATNGLNNVNDSTVQLGGSLTSSVTVAGGANYTTSFTGSRTSGNATVSISNSSSGAGLSASSSSGVGVEASSTSGTGLTATSTSLPAQFQRTGAITNTSAQIVSLTHLGGTVTNGFGAHLAYTLETSNASAATAGKIGAVWTDATTATRTSKLEFFTYNSAAEINALNILGTGQIQEPEYGNGTFTGSLAYLSGWDASGNKIEVDPDDVGGGSEVNTIDTTLTTTGDITLPAEAILEEVLVKPTTSLVGYKIGTPSDDDEYFPATPVTAGSKFVVFDVDAHIESGSLIVRVSGITSSTRVQLIYKRLHR